MNYPPRTGVSYFGNRNPRHLHCDLEDIKAHNCTFVVHTFSENDQQFYKDTMAEMARLTKQAGLEVYLDPWGVGRVFGGETYSSFALQNPNACQVLPNGDTAPAVCFNHPKFRRFMQTWISDAAEIGADVLFWDEPHFYIDIWHKEKHEIWYCTCEQCQRKFNEVYGEALLSAENDAIIMFRDHCVIEFLQELCDQGRELGMRNAVCMLPFKDPSIAMSDWTKVAAIRNLDIFGTDPYWMFFDKDVQSFVGDFSKEVFDLCRLHGKEPQIWLQSYLIKNGRENELRQAAEVAYGAGIRNFAAWSYLGNAYMSYNRCDDPEKVWHVIGEIYADVLAGKIPSS